MSSPDLSNPPLVVIVGPTAVGKTELAIQLAEDLDGEIVSADSRLFYRGMDIGTAKPVPVQLSRVHHHLVDVADPRQTWSLAVFQQAASRAISAIHARGRLPFLVGGTGQYIHAVTQGWLPPEIPPSESMRLALEGLADKNGKDWLHARLALLDPASAASIDLRNLRRTVRALEVIFTTGRRFSEQRQRSGSPYRLLTLGLTRPRPELYALIDSRIEAMFAAGLLDEVRRLMAQGVPPDSPTMSAIGYRESVAVLEGRMTLDAAKDHMRRLTRVFVRRQANWFKAADPGIHWFEADKDPRQEILQLIRATFFPETT